MFIRLFRHSYFTQYLLLLVFAIALWIPSFLDPPFIGAKQFDSPLYNLLISCSNSKLLWIIFAFVIILLQSLIINLILTNNDIIRKTSLLGAATYILLISHLPYFQYFHSALISHFFILLTLYFLIEMYGKENLLRESFRLGFYIGLASMFYFPSIFFILFVYLTLLVFRVSGWRKWFIPIFSVFTPYLFLFTYYFVFDKTYIFDHYFETFLKIFTLDILYVSINEIIIAFGLGLLAAFSFFKAIARNSEKGVHIRKKVLIIILMMIISFIGIVVTNEPINKFTPIVIPITILMAMHFNDLKQVWFADIYTTLIILVILLNLYF